MSTAGIYNAWPTIIHGTEDYLKNQMKSQQAPHYFGGSQVPINLHTHHISGSGFMSMVAKDVGKQLIRKHILGEGFFSNATDDEYKSPPSKYHTNYETRGSMIEPKTGGRYTSYEAGQGRGIGYGVDDDPLVEYKSHVAEWHIQNDRKNRAKERMRAGDAERAQRAKAERDAENKNIRFSSFLKNTMPTTAPTAPAPPSAPPVDRPALGRIRPMGTGMMEEGGSFMGALGMGINDPHTYRKHSTGLCKSIGSNTYRTTKV